MARGYQTAQPIFVDDNMYKLPAQLMATILQTKDKQVDDTIASANALEDNLKAQGLKQDQPRLKQILSGYEQQVNDIVANIQKNPMDYNKYSGTIRNLSRSIQNDWSVGEVAAIQGNKAAYLDSVNTYKELAKKDPAQYTQDYLDALTNKSLSSYKGASYDPNTGQYQQYNGMEALGLGNLNEWVDSRLKDALPDVTSTSYEGDTGKWLVTRGNKTESMSEEDLNKILGSSFQADTNLQNALSQRKGLGLPGFQNVMTSDGNFNTGKDSIIGQAFNAGLEKFGFSKTDKSTAMQVNPYAKADYDKKLAEEDEDFVTRTVDDFVSSTGGADPSQFITNRNAIFKTIDSTKDEVNTIVMRERGYKSVKEFMAKDPNLYNSIMKGNFAGASNVPQVKRLQNQYNQVKLELAGQEGLKKEFREKYKSEPGPNNKLWADFLKSNSQVQINQSLSWEGVTLDGKQVTNKQIEATAETLVEGNHVSSASFRLPKGLTISGKDIGDKYMSINDLIDQGLVLAEPVKVPVIGKTGIERKDSKGNVIVPAKYELQYKLADGTGNIGFAVSGKSLAPVQGLNDAGDMEMGGIFTIRGKQMVGRFTDVATTSMKQFDSQNSKRLRTKLMLQKYGANESVTIPNTGVIYHGKDVYQGGKKIHSKNTVEVPIGGGKYKTYNANDPEVENTLSVLMYGKD